MPEQRSPDTMSLMRKGDRDFLDEKVIFLALGKEETHHFPSPSLCDPELAARHCPCQHGEWQRAAIGCPVHMRATEARGGRALHRRQGQDIRRNGGANQR